MPLLRTLSNYYFLSLSLYPCHYPPFLISTIPTIPIKPRFRITITITAPPSLHLMLCFSLKQSMASLPFSFLFFTLLSLFSASTGK